MARRLGRRARPAFARALAVGLLTLLSVAANALGDGLEAHGPTPP
ncbi:hypothetical protein [Pseudonocardia halophobica]|nr:hypothetical protein [Pseudonocardia halophobica]